MLPRSKVRSFLLHTLTESAPHDAEFLLHGVPNGGSSTGSFTVDSTAVDSKVSPHYRRHVVLVIDSVLGHV
jgi:hypothetical protein